MNKLQLSLDQKDVQPDQISQERLRAIAWELGGQYPIPLSGNRITLTMIHPHLGYNHWQLQDESIASLHEIYKERWHASCMIIRIYDITDILFDGYNAHSFIDLEVNGLSGNYYFQTNNLNRNYIAEIGFRLQDGHFHALARSLMVPFVSDKPTGNYKNYGLYIRKSPEKTLLVDDIFNASIYEKMNRELKENPRKDNLSISLIFFRINQENKLTSSIDASLQEFSQKILELGVNIHLFRPEDNLLKENPKNLLRNTDILSKKILYKLSFSHRTKPFQLIHCHEWYSASVGIDATKLLKIPMIFSLQSTEHERTLGKIFHSFSKIIFKREKKAAQLAEIIIVPREATRLNLIEHYDIPSEKIVILPTLLSESAHLALSQNQDIKSTYGLNAGDQIILFAGEISHASGADLIMDALPHVIYSNNYAYFFFVGNGPLKDELERRSWHTSVGHRCRFLGDLNKKDFEQILNGADFITIPARTSQGDHLAKMAIACGKPILTTHQANIPCVTHGENGVIAYDHINSIIWGLNELLSQSLQRGLIRFKGQDASSVESIVVQHYIQYEKLLNKLQGVNNA